MLASSKSKMERLEARLTAEQKQILQRAADLSGRTLTDFVITSAQDAASRVVRDFAVITLSLNDQKAFSEALLNPPRPNRKLKSAWKRYKASRLR